MREHGSGSISRLEDKPRSKCRKWVLRIKTDKGYKYKRYKGTYSGAEKELDKFINDCLIEISDITFDDYCAEWLRKRRKDRDISRNTIIKNESDIRRLLYGFKGIKLKDIDKNTVYEGLQTIRNGNNASKRELSGTTIKETYSTLKTILDEAVYDNKIPDNPVRKVKAPKVDTKKRQAIPFDELCGLFKRLEYDELNSHTMAVRIAIFSGLRRSEIVGLNWEDIHDGCIYVVRSIDEKTGKETATKSAAGTRIIPMLPALEDSIEIWRRTQENTLESIDCYLEPDMPVIVSAVGTRMRAQNLYRWWIAHRWEYGTDADLHELRHSFLTMLAGSGANALQLKTIAGWSSIKMADTYIHDDLSASKEAVKNLNERIKHAM